jgi:PAS domain S-box-containing protein
LSRFHVTGERPKNHSVWRPPGRRLQLIARAALIIAGLCIASGSAGGQSESSSGPKRILLLSHYGRDSPGEVVFQQGFDSVIKSVRNENIEVYREALESYRFPGEPHERLMHNYLQEKYAGRKIDVVVAFTDTALDFFLRYRDELFPGVPVVYVISRQPEPGSEPALSTGVWAGPNIKDTLTLALEMQPATREVVVIGGTLTDNRAVEVEAAQQLAEFNTRVRMTYLINRPLDEVISSVRNLPPESIILCQRQTRGFAGNSIVAKNAIAMIAEAANAPVYVSFDILIGEGTVGGRAVSHEDLGHRAARMALQILSGTKPGDIPIETGSIIPTFDWRQLQRWGIREDRLPVGSVVLFKQSSFWELYRWRIIGVLTLCVVEACLILALLLQRSRRARAEESRRLSEEKFSKAFRSSPDAFVITRQSDNTILEVNDRWEELLGYTSAEAIGRTTAELKLYAEPDHRESFLNLLANREFVRAFETEIRTRAGEIKHAVLAAEIVVINNEPCTLVIIRDVTEQRNSERALQRMTGQLISLRDEEQRRIAAELHDGLGQSLVIINNRALIGMRDANDTTRATEQFEEISSAASSAIDEVREIVYNLRPHDLGKLGLVQAIKSMVAKISDSSPIRLSTDLEELDEPLSEEAETSIYRMVQEALNNIIKHAEASEARIALKRSGDQLTITVADNGKGILMTRNGDRSGFGLVGIAERARMLGGSCAVDSTPGLGTTITLAVALKNGDACRTN